MVVSKNVKRLLFLSILVGVLTISLVGVEPGGVAAQDNLEGELPPPEVEVVNPYFTIERFTLDDGMALEKNIINGPPEPPLGFTEERAASIQPLPSQGVISNFPSYDWVFGCSAVSGAMIAAYYDRNGYPNMYAGPTNGGVMPLTDTSWPTWNDSYDLYPNNPLVASHMGVDGRTTKGSIDDYWVSYLSYENDPYIGNWTQHTWLDAIGDYMKTSQSVYDVPDGATIFFNNSSSRLTCDAMEYATYDGVIIADMDGTYGRKLFYEARGYSVGECYNQNTDNNDGGFTLADFKAEIDACHPVLLNLKGHSIVGYGYSGSTIFIRDTWDSNPENTYTMPWGGCLPVPNDCLDLYSVSVVHLDPVTPPPPPPGGVSASDGIFTDKVRVSWNASSGATHYKVYRNTSSTTAGSTELTGSHASISYDDVTATPGTKYYYWVKACNSTECSGFSRSDLGYVQQIPLPPTDVIASDGAFTNKVQIAWSLSEQATYYVVFKNTINSTDDATALEYEPTATFYEDEDITSEIVYYYWIQACNSAGCSDFSSFDSGYAASTTVTVPSRPSGVSASDGTYMDKVLISWSETEGAAHYEVYRTVTNSPSDNGDIPLTDEILVTTYDDYITEPNQLYYYWVKACNEAGCSDYSDPDMGWREVYYIYLPLIYK